MNILWSQSCIPQLYLLQAWCNHKAEVVESAVALKDLKLLVGSAGLELPKVQEWIPTEAKSLVSSGQ